MATFAKVTGKTTTLHFAPDLVKNLGKRGVGTVAMGKARLIGVPGTSNAVLTITAGRASFYKASAKTKIDLQHTTGGLTLSSDNGSFRINEISLHLGSKPSVTARVVITAGGKVDPAQSVRLFELARTASFKSVIHKGTGTVSGLRIYLGAQVAQLINKSLGVTAFPSGKRVFAGTAKISITKG